MRNFNLIEWDVVYKNFIRFLIDFESDIQELNDMREIKDLILIQSSRVVGNSSISLKSRGCELTELESLKFSGREIIEMKNHLELGLLHKTNIDSLSDLIESLDMHLKVIGESISDDNILISSKRNSNTIDELISDK